MNEKRYSGVSYLIDRYSVWAQCAVILMICSAVFRLIGSIGRLGESRYFIWQFLLPLCCNGLMILCITLFGKKGFWLSFIPTAMGAMFFIVRGMEYETAIGTVVCTVISLAAGIIYTCTVFGVMGSKWFLTAAFALPFIYTVLFCDLPRLRDTIDPPAFSEGMLEMSALCIMLAMLFVSLGMTKRTVSIEELDLPKMKAPIVIAPRREEAVPAKQETEPPAGTEPEDK